MFAVCVVLLVVGVLAILLELLIPGFDGFISGIIGVLALVASAILAVLFIPGAWILVLVNLSVLAFSVGVFYTYIKRKQLHGKIILSDGLNEDLPAIDLNGLIGKEGKTVTSLRPYGEADFSGVRVEVSSNGSLVDRGAKVRVVEAQPGKVVVSVVDGN